MKGLKKWAISFAIWIWQLPQNLLGLLLIAILRPENKYDFEGVTLCYATRMRGGISLGRYIIVRSYLKDYTGRTEKHELGHCKQSMILGPLYLFVIGIPSLIWAAVFVPGYGKSYYDFYTEKWADKLGGVDRC